MNRVTTVQRRTGLDQHSHRVERSRADGMMQRCGVRVEIPRGPRDVDSERDDPGERPGFPPQRCKDEGELLLARARQRSQSVEIVGPVEARGRSQGERRPARHQMRRSLDVPVDQRVLGSSRGRCAGIDQHVEKRNLNACAACDPRPRDQSQRVVELFLQALDPRRSSRLHDRTRHVGDVRWQRAVADRILGDEPQQVGGLEEAVQRAADLAAKPRAR